MSHFQCEHCGKIIVDSPSGYLTGCEHYPVERYLRKVVLNEEQEELFGFIASVMEE